MPIEGKYLQRYDVCRIFHGHRMDPLVRNGKVDIIDISGCWNIHVKTNDVLKCVQLVYIQTCVPAHARRS